MANSATNKADTLVAPAVRDLAVLQDQLTQWLGRKMPASRDIRVGNLEYPRGAGRSHETILFDASWTQDGQPQSRGLVVRIKPTSFTVYFDDMFAEQHQLMRLMHETGRVRVAETLWFEEDPGVLGAPFFVMEKLSGRVAVTVPSYMEHGWLAEASSAERAKLWDSSVAQLAAIHMVPQDLVRFLVRPGVAEGLAQEWDRWRRFLDGVHAVRHRPELEDLWRRLDSAWPRNQPPGLVWGDARIGNMMVGDDFEVLAVMDWEQPSLGGPLNDLGWWLFTERLKIIKRGGQPPEGWGDRAQTIARWNAITGISTADIEWYEAFAGFKMLCLSAHMEDMAGGSPANNALASGDRYLETCKLLDAAGGD